MTTAYMDEATVVHVSGPQTSNGWLYKNDSHMSLHAPCGVGSVWRRERRKRMRTSLRVHHVNGARSHRRRYGME